MSIYDEMQNVAREILGDEEFKQGNTYLAQITSGSGPVDDPGPSVETQHLINGAVRGVKWSLVNTGLAQASDMQITHAVVAGVIPTAKDFVIVDGIRYKVVQVLPKPAAGVPVAYTLVIRR